MVVELLTVKLAAAAPKFTAVEPVKLVPVIVTGVAVVLGPELGLTPVTVGAGGTVYVNWSAALVALVPPGVVTVTSTVPIVPAGAVAVMLVGLLTVKVAAVAPKSTAVAPANPLPPTVTDVVPVLGPEVGLRPVTVGVGGGV
jgi:hypothetical protein